MHSRTNRTKYEVGSVHKIQGIDLDLAGVIMGPDFQLAGKSVAFSPEARNRERVLHHCTLCCEGTKKVFVSDDFVMPPNSPKISKQLKRDRSATLIRNQYFVLLTRGRDGLYLYSDDEEVRSHLRAIIEILER